MKIAVINSGSSSLKFKLFDMRLNKVLKSYLVQNIGEKGSEFKNHHDALESIDIDFSALDAIGHRVVHGGEYFKKATRINYEVVQKIDALSVLAPLHNPANIEGIVLAIQKAPKVPQIAVFDTAFHSTLRPEAYMYPLRYEMYERYKIRRYGFHGTSHSYLLKEAAKQLGKRVEETNIISLHLGNGASVCAIEKGKSIDTSMGFTPLEGLMMGTRSGDIDPSIALFMQRELKMGVDEVDWELNHNSGLKGVCGSNDIRNIVRSADPQAKLALDMMVRRVQKYIGSYMVLLDRVDAVVFSGGIGENSLYLRKKIMDRELFKNLRVLVIPTDEELEIARECARLL